MQLFYLYADTCRLVDTAPSDPFSGYSVISVDLGEERKNPWTFISRLFPDITHIILSCEDFFNESPILFAAGGYAAGRNIPLVMLGATSELKEERFSFPHVFIDDHQELDRYLEQEYHLWQSQEISSAARKKIIEAGKPLAIEGLAQAVSEGDQELVSLYLDAGFSVDSQNKHGIPLVCLAVRHNKRVCLNYLLDQGADVDNVSKDRLYSPLMEAASIGNEEMVSDILRKNADPNRRSIDGQTALILAVGRGDVEITARLIHRGADPSIGDKLGMTALKYAELFHNERLLHLLRNSGDPL